MRVRKRSEASVIRYQLLVIGYRKTALAGLHDNGQRTTSEESKGARSEMGIADRERSYCTSLPIATCPGRRNVFTKSASPQTVIAGNRLNHFPFGTSGSVSSQSANKPIWLAEISRDRMRSSKWCNRAGGRLRRRILGIGTAAVESTNNRFANPRGLHGICRVDHALGQTR